MFNPVNVFMAENAVKQIAREQLSFQSEDCEPMPARPNVVVRLWQQIQGSRAQHEAAPTAGGCASSVRDRSHVVMENLRSADQRSSNGMSPVRANHPTGRRFEPCLSVPESPVTGRPEQGF
ncbi:MAG: hypothetical protein IPK19_29055 [Chloroflexi bacterium]|nr:hypothetical protein [Chloroflexota bacterium]